jgi:thiamine biosynthesis lipoprotein ApbE
MKKTFLTVVVLLLAWSNVDLKAQETITNAFDDLKRTGTVNEQDSEMRQATSDTALQKLLTQKQAIFVLLKIGCMISVLIKSFRPVGRNAFSTLGYN